MAHSVSPLLTVYWSGALSARLQKTKLGYGLDKAGDRPDLQEGLDRGDANAA